MYKDLLASNKIMFTYIRTHVRAHTRGCPHYEQNICVTGMWDIQ